MVATHISTRCEQTIKPKLGQECKHEAFQINSGPSLVGNTSIECEVRMLVYTFVDVERLILHENGIPVVVCSSKI